MLYFLSLSSSFKVVLLYILKHKSYLYALGVVLNILLSYLYIESSLLSNIGLIVLNVILAICLYRLHLLSLYQHKYKLVKTNTLNQVNIDLYSSNVSNYVTIGSLNNSNQAYSFHSKIARWLSQPLHNATNRADYLAVKKHSYIETLNAISDAVIKINIDGSIMSVNTASMALFGRAENELVGQSYQGITTLYSTKDIAMPLADILTLLNSPASKSTQHKLNLQLKVNHRQLSIEQLVSVLVGHDNKVVGAVIVLRDITNEAKLRDRLRYQANHDSVTKLYNRFKFEQRLIDAWHDAQDNEHTHALLQIDMDRFKLVNDNAGHGAGDQLLREVGQLLQKTVRQSDVCARIGGDEFAILLYRVDDAIVLNLMDKLNKSLEHLTFSYSGQVFDVAASIGATLIDQFSPPVVEVKRQADAACYLAKNQGVNGHQLFNVDDQHSLSVQQEPRWAARINRALELDQFELYYQPIKALDLIERGKHHIEILLRLRCGDELLSPNVFLPAVERFRLCDRVDYWVISKTFEWFESQPMLWERQMIAINLSGDSITNEELIEQITTLHKSCNFPANTICFEITETAAIASMSQAAIMVEKLRNAGFKIALDDFGKGFSTFSYLKSLPAQYIKIDGSYVKDILENTNDYSIVSAISTMAKTLNMKTIAEFVQCEETIEVLRKIGIDYVQGYGIAMPAPLIEYDNLIDFSAYKEKSDLKQKVS